MSKELAQVNTQAVIGNFTQKEVDTLKSTIAKGTTNEQFALFAQICQASGLNPFLQQIYCIVYNSQQGPVMSVQIAVEGIVALAKTNPQYKGFVAAEVKKNDEFSADLVTGKAEHKVGSMFNRGETVGAYCVAYREGAPDMLVIVTREQVEHMMKGRNSTMWKDYFDDMIVKHAIKRAFKRQFGIEVADDETVGSSNPSNNVENIADYRQDVTPTQAQETPVQSPKRTQQRNVQEAQTEPVTEPQTVDPAKVEAAKSLMVKNFGLLGIEKKDRGAYVQEKLNIAANVQPTFEQLQQLNSIMEEEITGNLLLPEELE